MTKHIQTRLHKGTQNPKDWGNCWATCFACLMDLPSPEDVPQVQEHFTPDSFPQHAWDDLRDWLEVRGWKLWEITDPNIPPENDYYIASGPTVRGSLLHSVIYFNGKLFHDPHPEGLGITEVRDAFVLRRMEGFEAIAAGVE
jgi:hypothetical protein